MRRGEGGWVDYDGQPSRLASQAFSDDCLQMLQPGGILVVNLFRHHAQYDIFVNCVRRSFDDSVLAVQGAGPSNSIVLARKGPLMGTQRPSVLLPPRHLETSAAQQLPAGFALILTALKDRRRCNCAICMMWAYDVCPM